MRISVLGCWAPYPRAGGACSGYLLQDGGANVMLEMGHGSFGKLSQLVDHRIINAAIITHYHPDHYADIHCLRHAVEGALRDGSRKYKVKLFLPGEPADVFGRLAGLDKAFDIVKIDSLPEETVPPGVQVKVGHVGAVRFYFMPTRHALPSFAVGVEGSGYIVYSGDTSPTEELTALADKANIFICEASGLDKDEEYARGNHMTARQAGELAKKARVKELFITHFYPEYNLEELRAQAQAGFGRRVELATEGDTYFVY